jgi:TIGR03009 family protein
MRNFAYAVVAILALAVPVFAQGAPQPAAPKPLTPQEENYLDSVLKGWEKSMTELRSFATKVHRASHDKALQAQDTYGGYALFLKANVKDDLSRARLELIKQVPEKKDKKNEKPADPIFEKYICTGTYLYEYVPANKVVRVHNMPQNGKGKQQESFLSFLFGMGAKEAKDRYEMRPVFSDKPDPHYHYIRVKPKLPQDKNDFSEARLSLLKTNFLPAQIWYLQPNGNEITWNFTEQRIDVDIPLTYFQPDMPNGWTVQRVQPPPAPGAQPVIRTKSP